MARDVNQHAKWMSREKELRWKLKMLDGDWWLTLYYYFVICYHYFYGYDKSGIIKVKENFVRTEQWKEIYDSVVAEKQWDFAT